MSEVGREKGLRLACGVLQAESECLFKRPSSPYRLTCLIMSPIHVFLPCRVVARDLSLFRSRQKSDTPLLLVTNTIMMMTICGFLCSLPVTSEASAIFAIAYI